jgi:hypothetical protein
MCWLLAGFAHHFAPFQSNGFCCEKFASGHLTQQAYLFMLFFHFYLICAIIAIFG